MHAFSLAPDFPMEEVSTNQRMPISPEEAALSDL
jgi:hypothetical protein